MNWETQFIGNWKPEYGLPDVWLGFLIARLAAHMPEDMIQFSKPPSSSTYYPQRGLRFRDIYGVKLPARDLRSENLTD